MGEWTRTVRRRDATGLPWVNVFGDIRMSSDHMTKKNRVHVHERSQRSQRVVTFTGLRAHWPIRTARMFYAEAINRHHFHSIRGLCRLQALVYRGHHLVPSTLIFPLNSLVTSRPIPSARLDHPSTSCRQLDMQQTPILTSN